MSRDAVACDVPSADPFGERQPPLLHQQAQVLGGQFHFETDSPELLEIVRHAYQNLPAHTFSHPPPRFTVRLFLTPSACTNVAASEPPQMRPLAGNDILCGALDESSCAIIDPLRQSALLVVSERMLPFPYHVRYELIEFAVYTLAARAQGLIPLHAACIGRSGCGILLMGPSGAGKSTVTLQCVLRGLEFLAEDSVLVQPENLLATGLASFLHLRHDSLRFLTNPVQAASIANSPVIQRRSGVEKLEIDLRGPSYALAPSPLCTIAVVFLSNDIAPGKSLLVPVHREALASRLAENQRYAANQPGWSAFERALTLLPAFELRRGDHPLEAAEVLSELLESA
ncbi:serine kinase [Steroidobacter cummioxidans]|uniref:serine kinase n=1 Tax=Steroidobacter cummioxidans TaxID=1803913 RepID=UPI000E31E084|nr:serine kinase [Steroidobacter cummioxidans]